MRIAVLERDRCYPKRCSQECINFCPRVRSGDETIVMDEETGKPVISEELCVGCGICVHKCPFDAIHIENLADELEEDMVHRFGENAFRLFRLPVPQPGKVVGILGQNGIGKTTAIRILSGQMVPNLGNWSSSSPEAALEYWKGTEMHGYLQRLFAGDIYVAYKSQYVDQLARQPGTVGDMVGEDAARRFGLEGLINRSLGNLSGGELQQVAIVATVSRDADIYFFDEPSSYLDIERRIAVARAIRELAERGKMVMVVEHDLAVLDFLADVVHLIYGKKGVYGVVTQPKSVRHGINLYLSGYLKEENIRFGQEIAFEVHPPPDTLRTETLLSFGRLQKTFEHFILETEAGEIHRGEVIGVVGPNAIGKTTFVKMLAGVLEPAEGEVDARVSVSYKPQYVRPVPGTVRSVFLAMSSLHPFYEREIVAPLGIDALYDKPVKELSGGELQTVAIGLCLARQAELYLIDEPSAYLDASQRMSVAKVIKKVMENQEAAALVVDHDVYFIDLVSQSLMVFSGEPEVEGRGRGPYDLRTGMNIFLKDLGVTFRRDEESNRPRVNKPGSRLDREQRAVGEYYYEPLG
ncbi:MAG: ribosome biogenesis/translation initiation ATPase RLI [Candidatus Thermoplasmatota archaeon]|nr:ribosome biogenesis/translation initiation ATPase RLI [Candidatus Thermoplasmatota archaeon]